MPVITNISIPLEPSGLLKSEGENDHPEIVKSAQWAVERTLGVVKPRIVFKEISVAAQKQQRITVGDTSLTIGPMVKLLKPAQSVMVAVATVGAGIDRALDQEEKKGRLLEAYMLGRAATEAMEKTALVLQTLTEKKAKGRGWGVGPVLSPGALAGWDTSDQPFLCSLLPLADIGVMLTDKGLLTPKYSLSLLIGLGKRYPSNKVTATCGYCRLQSNCIYRKQ